MVKAPLAKNVKLYRECRFLCFTETWLTSNIQDYNVELPGFTAVRADRNPKLADGKVVALYVNIRCQRD